MHAELDGSVGTASLVLGAARVDAAVVEADGGELERAELADAVVIGTAGDQVTVFGPQHLVDDHIRITH